MHAWGYEISHGGAGLPWVFERVFIEELFDASMFGDLRARMSPLLKEELVARLEAIDADPFVRAHGDSWKLLWRTIAQWIAEVEQPHGVDYPVTHEWRNRVFRDCDDDAGRSVLLIEVGTLGQAYQALRRLEETKPQDSCLLYHATNSLHIDHIAYKIKPFLGNGDFGQAFYTTLSLECAWKLGGCIVGFLITSRSGCDTVYEALGRKLTAGPHWREGVAQCRFGLGYHSWWEMPETQRHLVDSLLVADIADVSRVDHTRPRSGEAPDSSLIEPLGEDPQFVFFEDAPALTILAEAQMVVLFKGSDATPDPVMPSELKAALRARATEQTRREVCEFARRWEITLSDAEVSKCVEKLECWTTSHAGWGLCEVVVWHVLRRQVPRGVSDLVGMLRGHIASDALDELERRMRASEVWLDHIGPPIACALWGLCKIIQSRSVKRLPEEAPPFEGEGEGEGAAIRLYHGTLLNLADSVAAGATSDRARPLLDFGRAFYATRSFRQAADWAVAKASLSEGYSTGPAVVCYTITHPDDIRRIQAAIESKLEYDEIDSARRFGWAWAVATHRNPSSTHQLELDETAFWSSRADQGVLVADVANWYHDEDEDIPDEVAIRRTSPKRDSSGKFEQVVFRTDDALAILERASRTVIAPTEADAPVAATSAAAAAASSS